MDYEKWVFFQNEATIFLDSSTDKHMLELARLCVKSNQKPKVDKEGHVIVAGNSFAGTRAKLFLALHDADENYLPLKCLLVCEKFEYDNEPTNWFDILWEKTEQKRIYRFLQQASETVKDFASFVNVTNLCLWVQRKPQDLDLEFIFSLKSNKEGETMVDLFCLLCQGITLKKKNSKKATKKLWDYVFYQIRDRERDLAKCQELSMELEQPHLCRYMESYRQLKFERFRYTKYHVLVSCNNAGKVMNNSEIVLFFVFEISSSLFCCCSCCLEYSSLLKAFLGAFWHLKRNGFWTPEGRDTTLFGDLSNQNHWQSCCVYIEEEGLKDWCLRNVQYIHPVTFFVMCRNDLSFVKRNYEKLIPLIVGQRWWSHRFSSKWEDGEARLLARTLSDFGLKLPQSIISSLPDIDKSGKIRTALFAHGLFEEGDYLENVDLVWKQKVHKYCTEAKKKKVFFILCVLYR